MGFEKGSRLPIHFLRIDHLISTVPFIVKDERINFAPPRTNRLYNLPGFGNRDTRIIDTMNDQQGRPDTIGFEER